jgi:outer membrane autotransporter protein
LSAERITTPDYDESTTAGSDALALHHDDEEAVRARTELGLEAAARLSTTGSISANLRVAWAHEFIRDHAARASFQGLPGAFFEVRSAELDADVAVIGAGLSAYLGDRTALRFNVAGEFGSRSEAYSGFIGLHTSW